MRTEVLSMQVHSGYISATKLTSSPTLISYISYEFGKHTTLHGVGK